MLYSIFSLGKPKPLKNIFLAIMLKAEENSRTFQGLAKKF